MDSASLPVGVIAMGLVGGLSIFLYGMDLLTSSMKILAGDGIRRLLARITTNRFKGVLAGAITTAIIQSSSVTTVLCVGFVSAGLMNLRQSISIIMGAGIGTTVTAQVIAFKITQFALLAVTAGFAIHFFFRGEKARRYGLMVLGLGLVFFGMGVMGDATHPLREYPPFVALLREMQHPLFAVLLSAAFTALIQSSSATTAVIIVLASQGLISLEQGIALVFGANIGTSVTAVLASIGKPREAVRTALVHVVFNVLGVLIWIGFIGEIAAVVRAISPAAHGLSGVDRLAAETPRQVANAHTLFNVGNTLIFIGFTGALASLVTWLVPPRPERPPPGVAPVYLDPMLLDTPPLAFDRVRLELGRLAEQVLPMVESGPRIVMTGSEADLQELEKQDDGVDALHDAILAYLGDLSKGHVTQQQSELLHDYLSIAGYFESIGDTLETNLVHAGRERILHGVMVSPETQALIGGLTRRVYWAVGTAARAVADTDQRVAMRVIEAKEDVNRLVDEAERHLARRLVVEAPHRLATYRLETELIENLKRVYYFAKRIAKAVIIEDTILSDAQAVT